jgi:hypothetical protein
MITNKLITARDRLNAALRPQPPLDTEDLICLADLCPYDSQVAGEDWEAWSRWCGIFTRAEWDVLGYRKDARRYYEAGEGSVSLTMRVSPSTISNGSHTGRPWV